MFFPPPTLIYREGASLILRWHRIKNYNITLFLRSTIMSLIVGGLLFRFCQKISSISIYYHPPTLRFLPEGRRNFYFPCKKCLKLLFSAPFWPFLTTPPFITTPPLYDFPGKVLPSPVIPPPYN